ncbi:MAG TPA: ABC transporter ATP-binding protein [Streptosporangiaceae bacterium]
MSFDVSAGRVLVVLGPSGAGKTTLLEVIAGLRPHRSGRILLGGEDVTRLPPERRRIGMVFQGGALFPHLSVRENVRFGPRTRAQASADAADALLDRLGITHLADRSPRSLSGGERQRAALARALATRPDLLLLDEPLSALDPPTREEIRALLQELLSGLRIPTIHVTHDRDEALTLGDHLAVVAHGALRQTGPTQHVVDRPADHTVARQVGWTELGAGTARHSTIQLGDLNWRDTSRPGPSEAVRVYYRPEDVLLRPHPPDEPAGIELTARVEQITPTRPLARVTLASTPPVTALLLHREIDRLSLRTGAAVHATLPHATLRILAG